jgi:hypothetical protein
LAFAFELLVANLGSVSSKVAANDVADHVMLSRSKIAKQIIFFRAAIGLHFSV